MKAVAIVAAVAAVNLLLSLSANPLFGDEAFSYGVAAGPLEDVPERVRATEIAPPGYYVLLWAWLKLGPDADWWLRLPSVLAALALVAATGWLAHVIAGRRAAVGAALLAALSPLVLQYAQQARAYALAMALVTVAAAAWLKALDGEHARDRWLALSAICGVAALWSHYTAALIVGPLALWVAVTPSLPTVRRAAYAGTLAVAAAVVAPLAIDQLGRGEADHASAGFSASNLAGVVGTPFDGRYRDVPLAFELAAAAVLAVLVLLGARAARHRRIALVGLAPVAAVLLFTLVGERVMWTRYTAVAAPLLIALMAAGVAALRTDAQRIAASGVVLVLALVGTVLSHDPDHGYYASTEHAVAALAASPERTLPVVLTGDQTTDASLRFYLGRRVPRAPTIELSELRAASPRRAHLVSGAYPRAQIEAGLRELGYVLVSTRRVGRGVPVQVSVIERAGGATNAKGAPHGAPFRVPSYVLVRRSSATRRA